LSAWQRIGWRFLPAGGKPSTHAAAGEVLTRRKMGAWDKEDVLLVNSFLRPVEQSWRNAAIRCPQRQILVMAYQIIIGGRGVVFLKKKKTSDGHHYLAAWQ